MKITNNGDNRYGVNIAGSYAFIPPGESRDLDLSDDELTAARNIEQLSFDSEDDDQLSKEELLEKLAELGITPDKRTGLAKLQGLLEEAEAKKAAAELAGK